MALAALALTTFWAPAVAGAKKHKHRPKRQEGVLIASDTGANPNPDYFWGGNYCASDQRVQQITTGGDPQLTAIGTPQGNSAFRRLTVFDGDDSTGERCELGWDNRESPTVFYRQGGHLMTQISFRLPTPFPLGVNTWQAVMQMKQAGPAANSGGTPVIELDAYAGRWRLRQSLSRFYAEDSRQLWSAPAHLNFWTRFLFDVRYSDRKKHGYIRVGADLNGDGDYADPGERSPAFHTYTLKAETPGGSPDGVKAGKPIPSDLSTGVYHNSSIPCPAPAGCSVDIDNVQVLRL